MTSEHIRPLIVLMAKAALNTHFSRFVSEPKEANRNNLVRVAAVYQRVVTGTTTEEAWQRLYNTATFSTVIDDIEREIGERR